MANNLTVLKTVVKKLAKLGALGVILAFVSASNSFLFNSASCPTHLLIRHAVKDLPYNESPPHPRQRMTRGILRIGS